MARVPLLVTAALITVPLSTPVYAQHEGAPASQSSTTAPKTTTHTTAHPASGSHASSTTGQTNHSSTTPTKGQGATTTSPTGTRTPLTPVQAKLMKNTNLAGKLQSRLPHGTNLQTAAYGFHNLGQFVAAVNVSNNLGIPFDRLKADMVTKGMSLGQSIQDLKHTQSADVQADIAEVDARVLILQTSSTTTTTIANKKGSRH